LEGSKWSMGLKISENARIIAIIASILSETVQYLIFWSLPLTSHPLFMHQYSLMPRRTC
jgi:hypothetical protein